MNQSLEEGDSIQIAFDKKKEVLNIKVQKAKKKPAKSSDDKGESKED